MAGSRSTKGPLSFPRGPVFPRSHRPAPISHWSLQKLPATLSCPALGLPVEGYWQPQGRAGQRRAYWAATLLGTWTWAPWAAPPAASAGRPHLAAEPVAVGLSVNLHDDVIHLCDPHKPVALQEPGRELGSACSLAAQSPQGPGNRWEPSVLPDPNRGKADTSGGG